MCEVLSLKVKELSSCNESSFTAIKLKRLKLKNLLLLSRQQQEMKPLL